MSATPSAVCADNELVARYEELRRQVLDRSSETYRGPGLALLTPERYEGVDGDVSSNCLTTPSPTILRASNREDVLASNQRGDIVLVLAAMALHRYQEANR